jgi:rubredoxin
MRCAFCGFEFDPKRAQAACLACPLIKDCRLIRCPRCGYEMPPEAKLITWLRKMSNRLHQSSKMNQRSRHT